MSKCALVLALLICAASAAASPTIDSINPNATPAQSPTVNIVHSNNDIGWYYTPAFDYDLDGIFSEFSNRMTVISKTATVEIQTERPVNGGTVLRQGTFTANQFGGRLGATFSPIRLEAGETYFVDFLNVQGIGVNVGMWQNDAFGNPQPSNGATLNLGAYYRNSSVSDHDFASVGGPYSTTMGVNVAGGEPILFFNGTPVPEPGSVTLVILLGTGLLRRRR